MDNQKKIIFIPGFPYSLNFYKKENGLDIWVDKNNFKKEIDAQIVVGHSLGANLALIKYNKAIEKIILFNPVIGKKNYLDLFSDWVKHMLFEKQEKDKAKMIFNFFRSLTAFPIFVKTNYEKILQNIPAEKIVVYHGIGDKYLCDKKCLDIFRKFGITIIETEKDDHNWLENFNREIEKIINN